MENKIKNLVEQKEVLKRQLDVKRLFCFLYIKID